MNILIVNGPNLNLLGKREPDIYGTNTYGDLIDYIEDYCGKKNILVEIFQSNSESSIIEKIQAAEKFDGIVINAAAYTHTSIAILDALKTMAIPTVEVHISNPDLREDFRKTNYVRLACLKTFMGEGFLGYTKAIGFLEEYLNSR